MSTARPIAWSHDRTFLAVSYALVFTAFLPVALSGEVGWIAPAAFVAAMAGSLLRDPKASPPRPTTARVWTAALIASLGALVAWSLTDGNWLLHALEFALLMTVSRFFQRRFAKDYLQLYALSFILLLVAAVVHPGPAFAVCFLAYAILTMWGLTLLHLVREIEVQTRTGPEHLLPPEKPKRRWLGLLPPKPVKSLQDPWPTPAASDVALGWRTRRLIGPRFFVASSMLALGVLAISALFFFLFPRLGMGFFFAQTRGGKSVIGFSTDAELGRFGALKTNAEVVARVTFPDAPERLQQSLRLRGLSFDRFAGTGWTRSKDEPWILRHMAGRYPIPKVDPPDRQTDRTWRAEIYLEPLQTDVKVLFAPPRTYQVELLDVRFDYLRGLRRQLFRTASGDLSFKAPGDTALHYAVEVVEPRNESLDAQALRQAPTEPPEEILQRYTQLPPDLDPRIGELARKLAGSATTWYDKAINVENGLRNGWLYSLDGDQDADKPLEDFLFGKRRGHCEYFATSMALMLRTLGIPARPVHGFAGGAFNPYGGYRMIRQADAHAWVEVFFPRVGWRTFDPTPPAGQLAPPDAGFFSAIRQMADSAELAWYQWVVEYDLERQIEVFRSVGRMFSGLRRASSLTSFTQGGPGETQGNQTPEQEQGGTPVAVIVLGLLATVAGAIGGYRAWRKARDVPIFDRRIDRAARRLDQGLRRRGLVRAAWETWGRVAERLRPADPELASAIERFAQAYDLARYAPAGDAQVRQDAARLARQAADLAVRPRK